MFLILFFSYTIVFGATVEKEFTKTIPFTSSGNLLLQNVNGSVEVKSWNREDVDIKAIIKVKAGDSEDAEEFLKEVHINVYESSTKIEIEVDYPGKGEGFSFLKALFGWGKPNVSINFWIQAPKKIDLNLISTNGEIKVYDIDGQVYSKTTNGSMNLEGIMGEVELKTTNGSISANNINGDLDAKTTNGKINLIRISGNIKAKSTNGSITSEILELNIVKEMNFRTTNGSVKLTLPNNINADFEAKTTNGKIYTDFPNLVQGEISKKHISGKINNGGPLIYVRTTNGSITISKFENI